MEQIELGLFTGALALYTLSALLYVYYLISKKAISSRIAIALLITGWVIHTSGQVMRGVEAGYIPMANWYEFLSAFSWAIIAFYIAAERLSDTRVMGIFIVPISIALMIAAKYKWGSPAPLPPALKSPWFNFHILSAFLAYGSFAVAFGVAIVYLLQERNMKNKVTGLLFRRLPPLEVLDQLSYKFIVFAFPLLTIAIITGAIWAEEAWGRYWGWDPKETSSLVTWLIFAAYMHARITAGWRGKRAAWLAGTGFLMVLFTFFAVSYVSRLHGYL